jgi:hypothetical protein
MCRTRTRRRGADRNFKVGRDAAGHILDRYVSAPQIKTAEADSETLAADVWRHEASAPALNPRPDGLSLQG